MRRSHAIGIAALLACEAAGAQDFTVQPGWLVEAQPGTFYEGGVGSPSVAYDPSSDTYAMVFETMAPATATCAGGVWSIGMATSPDGLTWSVQPTPILSPQPGTYYSCAAAHPKIVFDDGTWKVWFKAEQVDNACSAGTPSWGCGKQTGVGYLSNDGGGWQATAAPVLNVTGFGFPSVTSVGGTWYMVLAKVPSLYLATSPDETNWTLDPVPVLEPGYTPWVADRVFNPALVCEGLDAHHPFTVFLGGKDIEGTNPNVILQGGWGMALSGDAHAWYVGASPKFAWVGDLAWRHWDAVRVGDNDYLVFFSEKDAQGRNRVGLATSLATWNEADIASRICP